MSREDFPEITLLVDTDEEDEQYSRDYRLDEAIAVAGVMAVITGHVRHDGDGTALGLSPDGLVVADTRMRFDNPGLLPEQVHQWRVTIEPEGEELFPTSTMLYALEAGSDAAGKALIREAIDVYQQNYGSEQTGN